MEHYKPKKEKIKQSLKPSQLFFFEKGKISLIIKPFR